MRRRWLGFIKSRNYNGNGILKSLREPITTMETESIRRLRILITVMEAWVLGLVFLLVRRKQGGKEGEKSGSGRGVGSRPYINFG